MKISFHCVACGVKVSAPIDAAGTALKCPKCGEFVDVPSPRSGSQPRAVPMARAIPVPPEPVESQSIILRPRPGGQEALTYALFAGGGLFLGVCGGVFISQYMPLFGGFWTAIAEPWSPARQSSIPVHAFVFGLLGAALGATAAYFLGGAVADAVKRVPRRVVIDRPVEVEQRAPSSQSDGLPQDLSAKLRRRAQARAAKQRMQLAALGLVVAVGAMAVVGYIGWKLGTQDQTSHVTVTGEDPVELANRLRDRGLVEEVISAPDGSVRVVARTKDYACRIAIARHGSSLEASRFASVGQEGSFAVGKFSFVVTNGDGRAAERVRKSMR